MRPSAFRARTLRRQLAAAALCACLAAGAGADAAAVRKALLEGETEAAASGDLYLVLLPREGRIEVRCEGVTLRSFRAAEARFAGVPGDDAAQVWPAVSYRLASGLAELPRPVIVPPGTPGAPAPAPVPATPTGGVDFAARHRREALDKAPPEYSLVFAPPLELAVRGIVGAEQDAGSAGFFARLHQRLRGGWRTLTRRWREDTIPQVTLVLDGDDARRLFLALIPEIRLLVVPPEPAGDGATPAAGEKTAAGGGGS